MPLALPHTAVAAVSRRDGRRPAPALGRHRGRRRRTARRRAGAAVGHGPGRRTRRAWSGRCARPVTRSPAPTSTSPRRSRRARACRRRPRWRWSIALALNDLFDLGLQRLELARAVPARGERLRRRALSGSWTRRRPPAATEGHALYLDTPRPVPAAGPLRPGRRRACGCSWSTPGSSTRAGRRASTEAAGGLREGRRAARRRRAAGHRRTTDLDAALERLGDDEEVRRWCGTSSPRTSASSGSSRCWTSGETRAIGPRPQSRATPRCGTTSGSPARSWTWSSTRRLASGALGARMTGGGFGGSAIVLAEAADVGHGHQGGRGGLRGRRLHGAAGVRGGAGRGGPALELTSDEAGARRPDIPATGAGSRTVLHGRHEGHDVRRGGHEPQLNRDV